MKNKQDYLEEILEKYQPELIVEIGTQRHGLSRTDDGQATELFAKYGKEVWSVDIDPESLKKSKEAVGDSVNLVQEDGEKFLRNFNKTINLLYLDGSDDPKEAARQYEAAKVQGVVVIDDCMQIGDHELGKGDIILNYILDYDLLDCHKHYMMALIPREDL